LLERFAEQAIEQEKLGQHNTADLLTISFSSNDVVGHAAGPDSPKVRDIATRTDRVLGKLFDYIDHAIGMQHVLVILTADHGVAPLPEQLARENMPGGRMADAALSGPMAAALTARFGAGNWLLDTAGGVLREWGLVREEEG